MAGIHAQPQQVTRQTSRRTASGLQLPVVGFVKRHDLPFPQTNSATRLQASISGVPEPFTVILAVAVGLGGLAVPGSAPLFRSGQG
jgi:hypothetical protein